MLRILALLSLAVSVHAQFVPTVFNTGASGPAITAVEYQCRASSVATSSCVVNTGDTTTSTITLGTSTTAGELIYVYTMGGLGGSNPGSVTDSASQSYTQDTVSQTGIGAHFDITGWYKVNSASGVTSVTWTFGSGDTAGGAAFIVVHYKGLIAAPHDQATNLNSSDQATPFTGTSATTTVGHELLIAPSFIDAAGVGACADKIITGTSGWTARIFAYEASDGDNITLMDQVVTVTGTYNGTGTGNQASTCYRAGISTFKGS